MEAVSINQPFLTFMTSALQNIIDAVNHNADILEKHCLEGICVHQQTSPSLVWPVKHCLGSLRPLIETYDSSGNKIGHGVNRQTQTLDFAELSFMVPIAGYAILRF